MSCRPIYLPHQRGPNRIDRLQRVGTGVIADAAIVKSVVLVGRNAAGIGIKVRRGNRVLRAIKVVLATKVATRAVMSPNVALRGRAVRSAVDLARV